MKQNRGIITLYSPNWTGKLTIIFIKPNFPLTHNLINILNHPGHSYHDNLINTLFPSL